MRPSFAVLQYSSLAGVAFLLHALWEHTHLPLYQGYEGISGSLPVWLYATLGDVGYTLLIALLFAVAKRNIGWIRGARPFDFFLLACVGFLVALGVEYKAMLLARWVYTDAMPIVWDFGVSPLVQMALLLPLSIYLAQKVTVGRR
jgi:hypothetical protein